MHTRQALATLKKTVMNTPRRPSNLTSPTRIKPWLLALCITLVLSVPISIILAPLPMPHQLLRFGFWFVPGALAGGIAASFVWNRRERAWRLWTIGSACGSVLVCGVLYLLLS
jgi:hypothetical protein